MGLRGLRRLMGCEGPVIWDLNLNRLNEACFHICFLGCQNSSVTISVLCRVVEHSQCLRAKDLPKS